MSVSNLFGAMSDAGMLGPPCLLSDDADQASPNLIAFDAE